MSKSFDLIEKRFLAKLILGGGGGGNNIQIIHK